MCLKVRLGQSHMIDLCNLKVYLNNCTNVQNVYCTQGNYCSNFPDLNDTLLV